jgi:alkylhydroperoxidase family enzyme
LPRHDLEEFEPGFAMVEQVMGFVPNSMFTMARVPGLLKNFQAMAGTVLMNGLISPELTQMVAQVASTAAGCRYCQAHTAHSAGRLGVGEEKLADLWLFETSEHFDDAERAALRLAFHAASQPNVATDEDFVACAEHFDDAQISAIVATISLFGYLNRWNDTMATDLEDGPTRFGERVLAPNGWDVGKHVGERSSTGGDVPPDDGPIR